MTARNCSSSKSRNLIRSRHHYYNPMLRNSVIIIVIIPVPVPVYRAGTVVIVIIIPIHRAGTVVAVPVGRAVVAVPVGRAVAVVAVPVGSLSLPKMM